MKINKRRLPININKEILPGTKIKITPQAKQNGIQV